MPRYVKCDKCQLVRINGVVCHEIGCPNGRPKRRILGKLLAAALVISCVTATAPAQFMPRSPSSKAGLVQHVYSCMVTIKGHSQRVFCQAVDSIEAQRIIRNMFPDAEYVGPARQE